MYALLNDSWYHKQNLVCWYSSTSLPESLANLCWHLNFSYSISKYPQDITASSLSESNTLLYLTLITFQISLKIACNYVCFVRFFNEIKYKFSTSTCCKTATGDNESINTFTTSDQARQILTIYLSTFITNPLYMPSRHLKPKLICFPHLFQISSARKGDLSEN